MTPATPPAADLLAHAGFVRGLARAALRGDPACEDIEQDVWLAALEGRDVPPRHMRGWLAAVTRRRAADVLRRRQRVRAREQAAARPERVEPTVDAVLRAEAGRGLVAAVLALREPYRTTILLRFLDELPPRAVAARLDVPVETVRSRVRRGLAELRKALHAEHEQDGPALLVPLAFAGPRSSTVPSLLLGGLAVWKKLALGLLVLLVLGAGMVLVRPWDDRPEAARTPGAPLLAADVPSTGEGPRLEGSNGSGSSVQTASAEATGSAILGTVMDGAGAPAVGARVQALPSSVQEPLEAATASPVDGVPEAYTLDDGTFRIPLDEARGLYTLVARTDDGRLAAASSVRAGADVRLVLSEACELHGHVLDLEGRSVPGAILTAHITLDAWSLQRTVRSDAGGRYTLAGIPVPASSSDVRGLWHAALVVDHPEFASLYLDTKSSVAYIPGLPDLVPGSRVELDAVLTRGATVRGNVLEEDSDRPVEGARVVVWSGEGGAITRPDGTRLRTSGFGRVLGEATTDGQGRFSLSRVPSQGFHGLPVRGTGSLGPIFGGISVIKDGFVPGHHEVPNLLDEAVLDATIRLWPGATLSGRVLGPGGEPAEGVQLWAHVEGRTDQYRLPPALKHVGSSLSATGPDGRFRLAGIRASRARAVEVQLWARRFLAFRGQGHFVAEEAKLTLEVEAGAERELGDIALVAPQVPRVRILVVDPSGAGVAGASVYCWEPFQRVQTSGDGAVTVYWPASMQGLVEHEVLVQASAPGRATTFALVRPARDDTAATRITLPLGGTVSGVVRDPAGRFVVGATLDVWAQDGPAVTHARGLPPSWVGHLATTTTDRDGRFTVPDLPEGRLRLVAALSGTASAPLETEAGEDDLVLVLPEAVAPASTQGGTADPGPTFDVGARYEGRPVASLVVTLVAGDASHVGHRIRPGVVRFAGVPDGVYTLHAMADGFRPLDRAGVRVVAGQPETPLDLTLDRGLVVKGRVTKRGGTSVNHTLSFLPEQGPRVSVPIRTDGTYEVAGLAPGRYVVASLSMAWRNPALYPMAAAENRVLVVEDGPSAIVRDLVLEPAGVLSVMLERESLAVPARVTLHDAAGRPLMNVPMADDGSLGLLQYLVLLPGRYSVRSRTTDGTVRERWVEIDVGESVSVQSLE